MSFSSSTKNSSRAESALDPCLVREGVFVGEGVLVGACLLSPAVAVFDVFADAFSVCVFCMLIIFLLSVALSCHGSLRLSDFFAVEIVALLCGVSGTNFCKFPSKHKFMIQRDGALTSLWQVTTTKSRESYISNRMLAQDEPFDVVIVGGGITGVSTGLLLQEAGFRCIIIEANTLCFGTTGGTTAHLNTILDTPYPTIVKNFGQENAALVARAVEEAIGLIRSNCEKYSISAELEKQTAFLFSQTDEQTKELEEIRKVSVGLGLKLEYTE